MTRDKFNATESARFATNSILKRLTNTLKHQEKVQNTRRQCKSPGFSIKQSLTQTLLVSSCCKKHLNFFYTTLYYVHHQNFYTSWEFFTLAALVPLVPFCISGIKLIFKCSRRVEMMGINVQNWENLDFNLINSLQPFTKSNLTRPAPPKTC